MNKKRVNRIVKEINKSIPEARRVISKLSNDEIIELRAELEGSKTHFGKWMNAFMVFFAGVLAILAFKTNWVDGCMIVKLLLIDVAALVIHCIVECKNAKKVRALSVLNDFSVENESSQDSEMSDCLKIENYEQLEQRQRKERQRMLMEWSNKQKYVNEQVVLLEESLSYDVENK